MGVQFGRQQGSREAGKQEVGLALLPGSRLMQIRCTIPSLLPCETSEFASACRLGSTGSTRQATPEPSLVVIRAVQPASGMACLGRLLLWLDSHLHRTIAVCGPYGILLLLRRSAPRKRHPRRARPQRMGFRRPAATSRDGQRGRNRIRKWQRCLGSRLPANAAAWI